MYVYIYVCVCVYIYDAAKSIRCNKFSKQDFIETSQLQDSSQFSDYYIPC